MADIREDLAPSRESQFLIVSLPTIRGLQRVGSTCGWSIAPRPGRTLLGNDRNDPRPPAARRIIAYAFSSFPHGRAPDLPRHRPREGGEDRRAPLGHLRDPPDLLGSTYVNDFNNLFAHVPGSSAPGRRPLPPLRATSCDWRPATSATRWCRWHPRVIAGTIGPDRVTRYNLYPSATISSAPRRCRVRAGREDHGAAANDKLRRASATNGRACRFRRKRGARGLVVFGAGIPELVYPRAVRAGPSPRGRAQRPAGGHRGDRRAHHRRARQQRLHPRSAWCCWGHLGGRTPSSSSEFAKRTRAQREHRQIAITAARVRLRPIVMTAMAFILGVLPLVLATAPSVTARRASAPPSSAG